MVARCGGGFAEYELRLKDRLENRAGWRLIIDETRVQDGLLEGDDGRLPNYKKDYYRLLNRKVISQNIANILNFTKIQLTILHFTISW